MCGNTVRACASRVRFRFGAGRTVGKTILGPRIEEKDCFVAFLLAMTLEPLPLCRGIRQMVAYVVFTREKMRNPEEYERYREKGRPAPAGHPVKPLALYGKHEVLEGPAIEGAVVLE